MSREIRHKGNTPSRKATAGKQAQRHKVIGIKTIADFRAQNAEYLLVTCDED